MQTKKNFTLPRIVPIAEDENLATWLEYLAKSNCIPYKLFIQTYFDYTPRHYDSGDYIFNLKELDVYQEQGFPSLKEAVLKHMALPANPFLITPRVVEIIQDFLFDSPSVRPTSLAWNRCPVYCPQCAREDKERYGRIICHIPHMIDGVVACYKHGVWLEVSLEAMGEFPVSNQEIRYARFVKDLYTLMPGYPLDSILEKLRMRRFKFYDRDVEEACQFSGYSDMDEYWHDLLAKNNLKAMKILRFLSQICTAGDIQKLVVADYEKKIITACSNEIKEASPNLDILDWDFPFVRMHCKTCDNIFPMYSEYLFKIPFCPYCLGKLDEQQRATLIYTHRLRPDYQVLNISTRPNHAGVVTLMHKRCKHIMSHRYSDMLQIDKVECRFCRKSGYMYELLRKGRGKRTKEEQ